MYDIRIPAVAAAIILCASPVLSQTVDVSGTGYGEAMSTAMPLSEGTVVVHANTRYDRFEGGNPDSPFATASGPCFGAVMVDKGAVSGGGLCNYTDGDGDVAVVKWTATGMSEEGRTMGDWMVQGGTGKWASITGGGTFDAGGDGTEYSNNITGEVTMN